MKKISVTISAVSVLIFFSGCVAFDPVWEFSKQRYTNTVSYFNTYYNAERLFSDAENDVLKSQKSALEKPIIGKQAAFQISSTARQKFTQSIEKNSKLLSYYPNSKWVDNSLLMIGKAYFYLDDHVKAERKFLELFAKFPQSNKIPEAKLWYGRSLLRQNKFADAQKLLEELYKSSDVDNTLSGLAMVELGEYFYKQQNYVQALELLSASTKILGDDERNATTQLFISDCNLKLGRFDEAKKSYEKVSDFSPVYYQLFFSKLQTAKIFVLKKEFDSALDLLSLLQSDLKNIEYLASIHFEIANTYLAKGETETAFLKYHYVDTAFAKTDEAARAYYTVATVYEKQYGLYDSAKIYYDKAKNEFPQSEINAEAVRRANIFTQYFILKKELSVTDSLFKNIDTNLVHIDTSAIVKLYVPPKKDTAAVKSKKTTAKKSEIFVSDSLAFVDSSLAAAVLKKKKEKNRLADSLQRLTAKTKFELGGLFYLEFQLPDSALHWYNLVLRDHSATEYAPRSVYTMADIYNTQQNKKNTADSLYRFLVEQFPLTLYAQEARKFLGIPQLVLEKDAASDMYMKAESLSAVNVNRGIELYKKIAQDFPLSPIAPKSLYAAGWLYENTLQKNDSALSVFRRIVAAYPLTQFASTVKPKIAEYEAEQQRLENEAKEKAQQEKEEKERIEAEKREKEKIKTTPPAVPSTTQDSTTVPKF